MFHYSNQKYLCTKFVIEWSLSAIYQNCRTAALTILSVRKGLKVGLALPCKAVRPIELEKYSALITKCVSFPLYILLTKHPHNAFDVQSSNSITPSNRLLVNPIPGR